MIMVYEKYKLTTCNILSSIPAHWDVVRLKYVVSCNDEVLTVKEEDDFGIRYIEIGDVTFEKGITNYTEVKINEAASRARRIVKTNDIIISTVRTYLKAIAKIPIEYNGFIVSTGFAVLRSQKISHNFLNYIVQNENFIEEIISKSVGASYPAISSTNLLNIAVPFPPLNEQTKIAQYLDHQTAIIDQLIQQKEKLIELLKEKRQAIINEAVTKGLNPKAKMKDSGIEWLGEVPENWKVLNFRYVIDVLTDFTANGSFADLAKNVTYLEAGYSRLIRLTDLRENLNNVGLYVSEDSHNYLSKSSLYGDEVLLANVGAYAGLAWKVPQLSIPSTLGPNMFLLKFNKSLNNDFAYYSLISSYLCDQLKNKAVSAAQPKLNKEDVRSCLFIQPPIEEQIEIIHFLSEMNGMYEKLINLEIAQIEKIKEFRQSIISEAVTGKIDVRDWKVN